MSELAQGDEGRTVQDLVALVGGWVGERGGLTGVGVAVEEAVPAELREVALGRALCQQLAVDARLVDLGDVAHLIRQQAVDCESRR